MPENQIITSIGTKLNNFSGSLSLNSFGSDGRLTQRLQPISKKEIQGIMIISPHQMSALIIIVEDMLFCNTQTLMKLPQQLLLKVLKALKMLLF
jgi:hypothetical protein